MKKIISKNKGKIIIALIVLIGGGYYYLNSKKSTTSIPTYFFGNAEKNSIISTVSGSGQISSVSQIDIKPKISADILSVNVKVGDKVKKDQVLAVLDSKDLQTQLRNAKNSLNSAVVALQLKLVGPTKESLAIAQNSVQSAKNALDNSISNLDVVKQTAADNLQKSQLALDNAKISLDNAQNSYNNAQSSTGITTDSSSQSLDNAYANAKITANSAFVSLRSSLTAADNILNISNDRVKNLYGVLNTQSLSDAQGAFDVAKSQLADFSTKFDQVSATWDRGAEEDLLNSELATLQSMKTLSHNMYTMLLNTIISSDLTQSTLDGYRSAMSSQESAMSSGIGSIQSAIQSISNAKLGLSSTGVSTSGSLSSAKASLASAQNNYTSAQNNLTQTIQDNANSIKSANQDIESKKLSYQNAQDQYASQTAKPRDIDVATARIQVSTAQNAYNQALDNMKNAKVTSPIDGEVAKVYQDAGSATVLTSSVSDPIVTVITQKKLANVSLNEVDAAKVKTGQKAMLTFNAIDGLSISGEVVEIDSIGTVSSGVVNYSVQVGLDTQDDRIKPQMSVSVSITVAESLNVVTVPNSAVQTDQTGGSYVETLDVGTQTPDQNGVASTKTPTRVSVTIGLSDDTNTEIKSGLKEGDQIIIKTVTSSATAATRTTSGTSLFGGGGGGALRGVTGGR